MGVICFLFYEKLCCSFELCYFKKTYHILPAKIVNYPFWIFVYVDVSITKESDDEDECIESQETVTSKPLKKGVYLLKGGFVHDSQDNVDTNGQYCIIREDIHHSMKPKLPLNAEVYISNINGYVKSGKFDCRLVLRFCCCFYFNFWGKVHYIIPTWLASWLLIT